MTQVAYASLNQQTLANLPRDKCVVFLSLAPLEQHGPHLPLDTDPMITRILTRRFMQKFEKEFPDHVFIEMPFLPIGTDAFDYAGTLNIPPRALRALVYEYCSKLAKDGFRKIIAVTAHGMPRHLVVLEEIAEKMAWRHKTQMICLSSPLFSKFVRGKLFDQFEELAKARGVALNEAERQALRKDYHGGMVETSILLAEEGKHVDPVYKTLMPAVLDAPWKAGKNSLRKVAPGLGYLGYPHLARKEFGEVALELYEKETLPDLRRFIQGENVRKKFHSMFYYIPFLRTDFKWMLILGTYFMLLMAIWFFLNHGIVEVTS